MSFIKHITPRPKLLIHLMTDLISLISLPGSSLSTISFKTTYIDTNKDTTGRDHACTHCNL